MRMFRMFTPDGPVAFQSEGCWTITGVDIGEPCDSGFWDVDAHLLFPNPKEVFDILPLEVDE